MFNFLSRQTDTTNTQEVIDTLNAHLINIDPDTPEYEEVLEKLERVHKLKSREKDEPRVSPDTLLLVLGNLAGILLILNYERIGIVTSKAMSFVLKAR